MIETFETRLAASAEAAFAYHEMPGALERLIPPWEKVRIVRTDESIRPGGQVHLEVSLGPFRQSWIAAHEAYDPPVMFSDRQVSGPFASWHHTHQFSAIDERHCLLQDIVDYQIPGGRLGSFFGARFVKKKLKRMFAFRHQTTCDDLAFTTQLQSLGVSSTSARTIAITGSRGMVGSEVVRLLRCLGHQVIRLDRSESRELASHHSSSPHRASERSVVWNPRVGVENSEALAGIDAVIHLAGKNIGQHRWSEKIKKELWSSRVDATSILAKQLAAMERPPRCFVTASAVGYYGDQADRKCDESQPAGQDFLAKMAQTWEQSAKPIADRGVRLAVARLGVVLSLRGGALPKLHRLFDWGLGGRLGSGRQYWSWISLEDAAAALVWLALNPACDGVFNLVAGACTNAQFTNVLSRVMQRPAFLPAPASMLRIVMGEMADGLLLTSTRANHERLQSSQYPFRHRQLDSTLRHALGIFEENS